MTTSRKTTRSKTASRDEDALLLRCMQSLFDMQGTGLKVPERYLLTMHQPANSGPIIEMTQEDLADILGMSRVQITRELTWLRGQGILSTTRARITISDVPALAQLCTDEARSS